MHAPTGFAAAFAEMERRYGILAGYVPELIDMRFGKRHAIQLSLDEGSYARHRPALLSFCRRVGFGLSARRSRGACKVLLLRERRPGPLPVANEEEMGRRFGYPACCTRRFVAGTKERALDPFINLQDARLAGYDTLPFELNPFLRTSPFHLHKHFPCRPDCPASRKAARRLIELVREHQPHLAQDIERFNRWPALVTGIFGLGFVFDGEVSGERLRYREVAASGDPASLLPLARRNRAEDVGIFSRLNDLLRRGDELRLEAAGAVVLKGGRRLGRLARPAHLAWKLLRFV
jgi:hypothetical protein